jgi:serine/threonine protein kinase
MTAQPCYYCGADNSPTSQHCPQCGSALLLQKRYRLTRVLGKGGFGVVYEAEDIRLNRHCAIKQVASSSIDEQQQIQNEVDILAHNASRCSFIPAIYDTWQDQQRTYIVMEYIDGPMLDQLELPWSPAQGDDFLRIMLQNLAQLHRARIIHRDLKPQNIKYTPEGRSPYMLLDFGISKQGTAHSIKALSPDYAPPEQAQGIPTDVRSDLYSLAATTYFLLTGISPLKARLQSNGKLPPPSQYVPSITPATEQALLQMLQPDANQRPADAQAALALLDTASPPAREDVYRDATQVAGSGERYVTTGSRESVSYPPESHGALPPQDTPETQMAPDTGSRSANTAQTRRNWIAPAAVVGLVGVALVAAFFFFGFGEDDQGSGGVSAGSNATSTPDDTAAGAVTDTPEQETATPEPSPTSEPTEEPTEEAAGEPIEEAAGEPIEEAAGEPTSEPAELLPVGPPVRPERIAFVSARDGTRQIYTMNIDGSDQTPLTDTEWEDMFPAWSPDGSRLLFDSMRPDATNEANKIRNIYVINRDGSELTSLTSTPTEDMLAAWSPDGSRIAFNSDRGEVGQIYLMDPNGSNIRLSETPIEGGDPSWSSDGSRIAFVSDRDGNSEIFVANADGSEQIQLTETVSPTTNWGPAWSPDGSRIAFMSDRDGDQEIFVMNADGSEQINLTQNEFFSDDYPSWSPDSERIAFYTNRDEGDHEIYIMNADGSEPERITNSPGWDGLPAWSP